MPLKMPKALEGGTWRAGRVLAKKLRPQTGGPPIQIRSDGTVFQSREEFDPGLNEFGVECVPNNIVKNSARHKNEFCCDVIFGRV